MVGDLSFEVQGNRQMSTGSVLMAYHHGKGSQKSWFSCPNIRDKQSHLPRFLSKGQKNKYLEISKTPWFIVTLPHTLYLVGPSTLVHFGLDAINQR